MPCCKRQPKDKWSSTSASSLPLPLSLLNSLHTWVWAQAMSSPEDLQKRWQVLLTYHGASPNLWRQHLRWLRAQYGVFAEPQIPSSYQNAVQVELLSHVERMDAST